jgi:hypothetical protein
LAKADTAFQAHPLVNRLNLALIGETLRATSILMPTRDFPSSADFLPQSVSERVSCRYRPRALALPLRLRLDGSGDREMPEHQSGWSREFDEPIALPDGRKLCMTRPAPTRERELTENKGACLLAI